ncbi:RNA polymerase sigma factor FliA [Marinagarivorans cellulosilyticus]|uniref:RNA polymerase sigma factor FliA n=1 Tax=Marinagarivorans cellulosilyticus TaxID=2721545 RepID=A0AAN1WKD2_9GAMM|nr:RNA polymerase sigma factor FliA [Marinagarivorans cellulosilyticus]BCD99179.1 RNA polymerase sigma factor for flagellar operon FliA [Marinagarivorans cellulosilyticus]
MYSPAQVKRDINVEDYAYLVKRIAYHMVARMPASVQVDDLIQAGMVGLLEAAQKFQDDKGAGFETYAGIRIRGAIVDEMRRGDWAPRSVHRNSRRINEAIAKIEAQTGSDATDIQVADELEVTLDEYHSMAQDCASTKLFSYEDTFDEEGDELLTSEDSRQHQNPADTAQKQAMKVALTQVISGLKEREQMVLSLYYEQELNLKEIGEVLGVSESRVSQILSQTAMRIRSRMTGWQR